MGYASGLQSQFGFVAESTYGTYAAPTKFQEFTSESLNLKIERIPSNGLRAGRAIWHRRVAGRQHVEGNIDLEFAPQGAALLWKHALGAVNTTGTNPYVHTLTPTSAVDTLSLTCQINKPDITGTDRVFSYLGCQIASWNLDSEINQLVKWTMNLIGTHEDTSQTLASASYPSGLSPFTFAVGTLSIAGSEIAVKRVRLQGDNGLTRPADRTFMQSTTPTRPKQGKVAARRMFTGSLVADFESLTAYNRYVNATEAALVLTYTDSASAAMTITTNVLFDGETPNVRGPGLLDQNLTFTCQSSTSDAAAITVVVTNADSSP